MARRPRYPQPTDFFWPAVQTGMMLLEAQTVIALRMWGMAGGRPMGPEEHVRMVQEKASAATEAGTAMMRAADKGPGAMALAGIKPVRRRTRANVKRLTKAASSG